MLQKTPIGRISAAGCTFHKWMRIKGRDELLRNDVKNAMDMLLAFKGRGNLQLSMI